MDEYMDIVGLSMNGTDKRNFYIAESIAQDASERTTHTLESNFPVTKQENIEEEYSRSDQSILDLGNTDKGIDLSWHFYVISDYFCRCNIKLYFTEYVTEDNPYRRIDGFAAGDGKKMEMKEKSPLMKTKRSRNQSKLKKDRVTDTSANLIVKPKKKRKKKYVQRSSKDVQSNDRDNNNKCTNLPGIKRNRNLNVRTFI